MVVPATDIVHQVPEGGVVILTCQWQFFLTQVEDQNSLGTRVDGVMQALLDLEEVDQRLSCSGVSLDLGAMHVVIVLDVAGDDYQECISHALNAMRTAIHAAGGATPDWPTDVSHPAHFEPQDFFAVPA